MSDSVSSLGSPGKRANVPRPRVTCCVFVSTISSAATVALCLVFFAPNADYCGRDAECVWTANDVPAKLSKLQIPSNVANNTEFHLIATWFAAERVDMQQASYLVIVAWVSAVASSVTSAIVVTFIPHKVQSDFESKGTLSNVSQDIRTPWGRMFAVMLFVACLVSMTSMYTLHIYPSWYPLSTPKKFYVTMYQEFNEIRWRILWATLPNVGLMYTALLPSLSKNKGTHIALSIVHNVAAPLAMAVASVMETLQLAYGENAFSHFFCRDGCATYWGPLNNYQRLRVVVVSCNWLAIIIFLSIQVYLGTGDVLGAQIKRSYGLSLVSFYSEITALFLIFSLPAIQGVHNFYVRCEHDVFYDAYRVYLARNKA
eukprot:TRINITY_DN11016_c0_g1_i1.p1 TRINITY_DN11016_c0_g1~~TRINITY_DN11016_c0_g1_i1.p1  ORF type:complete len:371 (+),score=11.68 TRINITY_DN11016_c0_g1_i1:161-1273(+)